MLANNHIMSSLGIFEITGIVLLGLAMAPEAMGSLVDRIIPLYTIGAFIAIVLTFKIHNDASSNNHSDGKNERIYKVPKKMKPGQS